MPRRLRVPLLLAGLTVALLLIPAAGTALAWEAFDFKAVDRGDHIYARVRVCTANANRVVFYWRVDTQHRFLNSKSYDGYQSAGCTVWHMRQNDAYAPGYYWTRMWIKPDGARRRGLTNWHRLHIR